MTTAYAPGKVILFGEHAVVYGQPALAIPVREVQASATITEITDTERGRILLSAPDIHFQEWFHLVDPQNPLAKVIQLTLDTLEITNPPAIKIEINSTIPIASGMGSSAAISIVIIRGLGQHLESPLTPERQSQIAFEVEKLHHGTPSGVDNTVIAYEKPVFFKHGDEPKPFEVGAPLLLIVADSGSNSLTYDAVGQVREGWTKDQDSYDAIFDQIGSITRLARQAIKAGQNHVLGSLMNRNQEFLRALKVSSPKLEILIQVALENGALGAKLSGAGLGGNMIALVTDENSNNVLEAIKEAGASRTILTVLENDLP
jgi:mevalonate kinase